MTKWIPAVAAGLMLTTALGGCAKQGDSDKGAGQAASDATNAVCDRDCLLKVTDEYVASFAKHSADGVPLESNVAVVENAKPIKVGEGLWKDVNPARPSSRSMCPTRSTRPPAGSAWSSGTASRRWSRSV